MVTWDGKKIIKITVSSLQMKLPELTSTTCATLGDYACFSRKLSGKHMRRMTLFAKSRYFINLLYLLFTFPCYIGGTVHKGIRYSMKVLKFILTLVYGVGLLSLSRLKLLGRLRSDLEDPPAKPERSPPPRLPLLLSLIMSSRDMLILSTMVDLKLVSDSTREQRSLHRTTSNSWAQVPPVSLCYN